MILWDLRYEPLEDSADDPGELRRVYLSQWETNLQARTESDDVVAEFYLATELEFCPEGLVANVDVVRWPADPSRRIGYRTHGLLRIMPSDFREALLKLLPSIPSTLGD